MEGSYIDYLSLGTAISALLGFIVLDVSKKGVKWYVSLTRAINTFLSERDK